MTSPGERMQHFLSSIRLMMEPGGGQCGPCPSTFQEAVLQTNKTLEMTVSSNETRCSAYILYGGHLGF